MPSQSRPSHASEAAPRSRSHSIPFLQSLIVRRIGALHRSDDAELAVGMGCEIRYAPRLVYARGLDFNDPIVTPIGPACRIRERAGCAQRAAEPIARTLSIDDFAKSIAPYPFVM